MIETTLPRSMQSKKPGKSLGVILLVDDDDEHRSMLKDFLTSQRYDVQSFGHPEKALEFCQLHTEYLDSLDLLITDLRMPNIDGLELVQRFRLMVADVPAILITAFGTIESAIEATKAGTFDYIVKPFELSKALISIERAVRFSTLKKENRDLKTQLGSESNSRMIGKSKEIHRIFDLIRRVSRASANVLVTGESGTGKELVARSIHDQGPRAKKAFIAINCTAIPATLLESELFGHAKGAFTGAIQRKRGLFEEADGGTLFLDEIGDLELPLQAKLLRAIQEKKVRPVGENRDIPIDVRIIAATHKDLKAAIKEGVFREDLFYRLCVIPVVIPPLRHRQGDIPMLVQHFLNRYCKANSVQLKEFSPAAMKKLTQMHWEGNVRELENMVERLVVMTDGINISESDIPDADTKNPEDFMASATQDLPSLEEIEKRYIRLILEKTGGRKDKASSILGINRRTLYRKEREYGFVQDSGASEDLES